MSLQYKPQHLFRYEFSCKNIILLSLSNVFLLKLPLLRLFLMPIYPSKYSIISTLYINAFAGVFPKVIIAKMIDSITVPANEYYAFR